MKKLILLFVLVAQIGVAQGLDETFKTGNTFYAEQNFVEALAQYNLLADSGWQSAPLFYNMGNSYYRLGKTGYAILYYEKALLQQPNDPDIRKNIKVAQLNKIDEFEVVPTPVLKKVGLAFVNFFNADVWAILGLIFVFAAATLIVVFLKSTQKSTWQFSLYVVFGLLGLFSLFMAYQKINFNKNQNYGVLVTDNAYVKSAPKNGEDLFIIHEGTKAQIEETYNDWVKVRFPDGNSGWLESEGFERI